MTRELTTRRLWVYSALICLLFIATLAGLDGLGKGSRVTGWAGVPADPKVAKVSVATPVDAYRFWKKQGIAGRTVVVVDDIWQRLDDNDLNPEEPVSRRYPLEPFKVAEVMEREKLNSRNFLYVAALNGIARRLVVVLSQEGFAEVAASAEKAKNKRITPDGIYLTHQGFPRWFTTASRFKGEPEPVVLYVNSRYFRSEEPEELFRRLSEAGLRTDYVVLCRGDEGTGEREAAAMRRFAALLGVAVPGPGAETVVPAQPKAR